MNELKHNEGSVLIQKLLEKKRFHESKRYSGPRPTDPNYKIAPSLQGDPISDSLDEYVRTKNTEHTVDLGYTNISRRQERGRANAISNLLSHSKDASFPNIEKKKSKRKIRELLHKIKNSEHFHQRFSNRNNNKQNVRTS